MAKPARAVATIPRYGEFDKMPLNGKWREGSSDRFSDNIDPYSNEVLVRIRLADERDLDEAFGAAAAAQRKWCETLPGERSAIIRRAGEIMEERREEIIDWLIHESGSTRIKA